MIDCILDLKDVNTETREQPVFYATHEFIIYQNIDNGTIEMSDCRGEVLTHIKCPTDWRYYECLDLGDAVLFIFSGKDIAVFDKMGHVLTNHRIDLARIGRIITKPFSAKNENCIIFGTRTQNGIQLVHYNFMKKERISQSATWKTQKIDDASSDETNIYLLMDTSFLTGCEIETCETFWTRFEANMVYPRIIPYKKSIFFSCQNSVRKYKDKKIENIRVGTQLHNLHHVLGSQLIVTTHKAKHIQMFDIQQDKTLWDITGDHPIADSILVKGRSTHEVDVVVFVSNGQVGMINTSVGHVSHYGISKNVFRIRQTEDHIIINKQNGHTDLIAGISDESF